MFQSLSKFFKMSSKKNQYRKLKVELLEGRECPAVTTWMGPVGGSWMTPGNWSTAAIPNATSDVVIPANSTVNFNAAANVTIDSLDIRQASTLNLVTTAANITLLVAGGSSSFIGVNAAGAAQQTIINSTNLMTPANCANITFGNDGSPVNIANTTFSFSTAANTSDLTFENTQVNITGNTPAKFDCFTYVNGGYVSSTTMTISNTNTVSLGTRGILTIGSAEALVITGAGGKLTTQGGPAANRIVNNGTITVDVGNGNKYSITGIRIKGNRELIKTGKLAAVLQGTGSDQVVIWSGAELDSTGGTSVFITGDEIDFVSDGNTSGVTLDGAFEFDGSTENFHVFELAMPNDATVASWTYGAFTSTPVSFAVNDVQDANGICSWTGNGDTENFDVDVETYINNVTLNVSGGQYTSSGTVLNVNATGSTPITGSTVSLITSTQSLDLAFASLSLGPWSTWAPSPYVFGLIC